MVYCTAMSRAFAEHTCIEFGPLTLFFFVSFIWGFYPGANALVVSTLVALIYSLYRHKRFAVFSFTVSSLILVCGTLTVLLHEPRWLVWEYTLSNLAFGIASLVSVYQHRPLLRLLFSHMFAIHERGWMKLTLRWGIVFCIAAITNQLFWEWYQDEDLWTLFRFISTFVIFIFGLSQLYISKQERLEGSTPWGLRI
jgi:intracellular septation protein